jgi:hypothetical protein
MRGTYTQQNTRGDHCKVVQTVCRRSHVSGDLWGDIGVKPILFFVPNEVFYLSIWKSHGAMMDMR